ncbi:hypothetical protein MRX96_050278 [Rhipicephalus microplus]
MSVASQISNSAQSSLRVKRHTTRLQTSVLQTLSTGTLFALSLPTKGLMTNGRAVSHLTSEWSEHSSAPGIDIEHGLGWTERLRGVRFASSDAQTRSH